MSPRTHPAIRSLSLSKGPDHSAPETRPDTLSGHPNDVEPPGLCQVRSNGLSDVAASFAAGRPAEASQLPIIR
jgi:hypothetical protein